ncbi:MAG: rhodanese-related sulfurtransferase [Bacteroidia bacterium]|nr:rhodanese-related sulfurtransferase [Bacteroidia bacterium]NNJ54754.1 rhodanese-related sulfurtransferase [Bacteroidia bacterium]
MKLHNTINGEELKERIKSSDEKRTTISFYKYATIGNPQLFRDHIYYYWNNVGVLGRIYVATEGINAQISVPTDRLNDFKKELGDITFLEKVRLNFAVDDDGKSFFKLAIKVKNKIVADGLEEDIFSYAEPAPYLTVERFNEITENPETTIIDMRNHYESEVGHFEGAWCPDVDTFREQLPLVADKLNERKEKPVVMYCTGGIRCEKASAYLKHKGFTDVYHLEGGIIKYSRDAEAQGLPNKFIGKNFVFDERLHERITDDVIANCHQCGESFDDHVNCKNKACNLLFIQCPKCAKKFNNCCSEECATIAALPEEEQKELRKGKDTGVRIFSKGRFRKPLATKK